VGGPRAGKKAGGNKMWRKEKTAVFGLKGRRKREFENGIGSMLCNAVRIQREMRRERRERRERRREKREERESVTVFLSLSFSFSLLFDSIAETYPLTS
jgi:hypothetical protein